MKKYLKVSLKQLKQELSSVAGEAAAGTTVDVTRYNKPYLRLLRAEADNTGVLVGKNVGDFCLRPLKNLKSGKIKGSIVQELLRDRA